MLLAQLFDRRLVVVVGKGGVGKTSVASALAGEAARRGLRVLLVEVDGLGRAAQLFGVAGPEVGRAQRAAPGLHLMSIEGKAALAEYLNLIVPVKRVIRSVLTSRIYQYFVAAAPGLKELMTVGKIWYEAERADETTGKRRWCWVFVEAPATGHSLQYLRMPQAAAVTFGAGLVHREAQRITDLLQDPAQTAVVFVTVAEEMPVNETVEMYHCVRAELGLPAACVVVNRVHQPSLREPDVERLRQVIAGQGSRWRLFLEEVLRRAQEEAGWIGINERYVRRVRSEIPLPTVLLPFLFTEEFGLMEIKELGALLRQAAAGERPTMTVA